MGLVACIGERSGAGDYLENCITHHVMQIIIDQKATYKTVE
jgi:hypothetical protein